MGRVHNNNEAWRTSLQPTLKKNYGYKWKYETEDNLTQFNRSMKNSGRNWKKNGRRMSTKS